MVFLIVVYNTQSRLKLFRAEKMCYTHQNTVISPCETCDPWGDAKSDPRALIWALLVEVH